MSLEWKKEYNLGIEEIDRQHKEFVRNLSLLIDAIGKNSLQKDLQKVLEGISNYAEYHFSTEERYFDEFYYEGAVEHKEKHQEFRNKIKELLEKFSRDELTLSYELADFLEDWLFDHLLNMDGKYVECFKSHGLK